MKWQSQDLNPVAPTWKLMSLTSVVSQFYRSHGACGLSRSHNESLSNWACDPVPNTLDSGLYSLE